MCTKESYKRKIERLKTELNEEFSENQKLNNHRVLAASKKLDVVIYEYLKYQLNK